MVPQTKFKKAPLLQNATEMKTIFSNIYKKMKTTENVLRTNTTKPK